MVKSEELGLYLLDGCRLYDDEEITDEEIVGENVIFLDEKEPPKDIESGE